MHDRGTTFALRKAMGGRGAVPIAVALWLGLALGARAGAGVAWGCLAVALALAWLANRAPPRTGLLLVTAIALLCGIARGTAHTRRLEAARAALPQDDAFVHLVAVLDGPARREGEAPQAVVRVLAATPHLPLGLRVRLRLPERCGADWGDTLSAFARLSRFDRARNPGAFDARAAADAAGVLAQGRAYAATFAPTLALADLPIRAAMRLRRAMEAALARELSPGAIELAAPLLFGDRSAMSPELDAALRGSGLVHLLALSGLHVVWLAAVARGLAAFARRGVRTRALAGAGCAVLYAMLAGPLPSLMRAVAGECANALARWTQRALDPVHALALGTLVLLGVFPGWAHDLGFQLSCAATFGLLALAGPLASPLPRWNWLTPLAQPAAVTLAAQLAALPVLLARFHALPWTGLLSNLLAVPVSELLLAGAWLGGLAEVVLPGVGKLPLRACEPLAWALRTIANLAASWPDALAPAGADPAPVALAATGTLLLVLALPPPRTLSARRPGMPPGRVLATALGTALVACAIVAALTARPLLPPPGRWWLVGLDVGQGDALALGFDNEWWLVDAGPRSPHWDSGEGTVVPFFRWAGVRSLRRLVLTHDDGDHTGGAAAVRRALRVFETDASASRPEVPGPGAKYGARALGRGDALRAWPDVEVLWPPRPGEAGEVLARRGDNAAAIVLEVGDGTGRALLMADADSLVEDVLDLVPGVAVLKAGHHGSGSSSGAAFTRRVAPRRVLLSVGPHNSYGHPHAAALAHLAATGAALDRTDREGTLWYELGADGARRVDWRRERPGRSTRARPERPRGPAP